MSERDDADAADGRALAPGGPDSVTLPAEGYVDVFAVAADGAHHHLMRVPEGVPLFGAPPPPAGIARIALVPGPGADVVQAGRDDWIEAQEDEDVEDVVERLADAVHDWSAELPRERAPAEQARLEPGEPARARAGEGLGCDHGVVLVRLESGSACFAGAAVEIAAGARLMLSSRAWLVASGDLAAEVEDLDALDELGPAVEACRAFQHAFLLAACERAQEEDRDAPGRLRERVRTIESVLDDGMLAMRRLLEAGASAAPAGGTSRAALFAAARLVAEHQGMAAVEPRSAPATAAAFVQAIAEASGFRVRSVTLGGQWWGADSGPMLAFRADDEAPVVLLPGRRGRYRALDPASGAEAVADRDYAATLKSFAFCFYRPFPQETITLAGLLRFGLRGQARHVVPVLGFSAAIALLALLVPLVAAVVVDQAIPSAQTSTLLQLGLVLLAAAAIEGLFSLARGYFLLRVQSAMEHDIQAAVWDRVLGLPIAFFRDFSVGDLAVRVNAINTVFRMLSVGTLTGLLGGLFMLFNFIVLLRFSVLLSLVAAALVVVAAAALWLAWHVTYHRLEAMIPSQKKILALVFQLVQGVGKLRSTASEARAFGVWAGEFSRFRAIRLLIMTLQTQQKVFFAAYLHVGLLALFVAMAAMLGQPAAGAMTAGQFVGFFAAFSGMFLGALGACEIAVGLFIAPLLFKMAQPILEALPETGSGKVDPGRITGAIEVSQAGFSYPDGEPVLDDVSFSVPAGSFTAVVGPSGSGKSTLLRLLLAFDQPSSGAILYDDKNLQDLDLRRLRQQFGVVLQNSPLMPGDLFSNIVGVSGGTIEDAWEAARLAGLADDIQAMPMGMHTAVGEGTSTLSGGQRQRILIARALVGRPRVLFLDEATSALDNKSQAMVAETLLRMKATRIVIAHRLSTIAEADQIVVLDEGGVVQVGTYDELMEDEDGVFYALARRQAAEDGDEDEDDD